MLDPRLELPDDTPIENIRLPSRIRNVLAAAGLKTVGEVRETTDATLLSFQDLGLVCRTPIYGTECPPDAEVERTHFCERG